VRGGDAAGTTIRRTLRSSRPSGGCGRTSACPAGSSSWSSPARPSGELETAAFLLDQDALRAHPPVRPEASRFRVEVKDLEAATGLDWGEVVRAAPEMPRE